MIKNTEHAVRVWARESQDPREIVFVRVGDFVETFGREARIVARILGLAVTTQTKAANSLSMVGFPARLWFEWSPKLSAEGYIPRLID